PARVSEWGDTVLGHHDVGFSRLVDSEVREGAPTELYADEAGGRRGQRPPCPDSTDQDSDRDSQTNPALHDPLLCDCSSSGAFRSLAGGPRGDELAWVRWKVKPLAASFTNAATRASLASRPMTR